MHNSRFTAPPVIHPSHLGTPFANMTRTKRYGNREKAGPSALTPLARNTVGGLQGSRFALRDGIEVGGCVPLKATGGMETSMHTPKALLDGPQIYTISTANVKRETPLVVVKAGFEEWKKANSVAKKGPVKTLSQPLVNKSIFPDIPRDLVLKFQELECGDQLATHRLQQADNGNKNSTASVTVTSQQTAALNSRISILEHLESRPPINKANAVPPAPQNILVNPSRKSRLLSTASPSFSLTTLSPQASPAAEIFSPAPPSLLSSPPNTTTTSPTSSKPPASTKPFLHASGYQYWFPQGPYDPAWRHAPIVAPGRPGVLYDSKCKYTNSPSWADIFDPERLEADIAKAT
ncbi:uncharacterized protein BDR25DRAFT_356511 [Lindgomyces ingoldianus]|uniref:Uncharacterized protein n=1 Tax=Lindgomyces ingoldianus TaxID=673940 RepID=A0ACB6QQT2_9PLEO|nr:uncharacterized protein BDR25DRAFT_356511 [Lindgomyces ingoldianus]KAF2469271.1 hypothetical protein BDR25DRAFT_356511 [Lindgomyces ingoldianus]